MSTAAMRWNRCSKCFAMSARVLPLVFAMHPRTRASIDRLGLGELVSRARIAVLPPQGYLEMLGLMSAATLVLTDSGGMQEETTALGVPCLTLRENTERPITIEQGTNTLVGRDRGAIEHEVSEILAGRGKRGRVPELWDGRAAERIAAISSRGSRPSRERWRNTMMRSPTPVLPACRCAMH
jgi:UDP-N-acetylglucosamine 2-epimerase (non-hydrolysing)